MLVYFVIQAPHKVIADTHWNRPPSVVLVHYEPWPDNCWVEVLAFFQEELFCFTLGSDVSFQEWGRLLRRDHHKLLHLILSLSHVLQFTGHIDTCVSVHCQVGSFRISSLLEQSSHTMNDSVYILYMLLK